MPPNYELAPHQVRIAQPGSETDEESMTEAQEQALADQDPAWRASDGTRYEALIVLPGGVSYGRRTPAPESVVPSPENQYGAWNPVGAPASPELDVESIVIGGTLVSDRRVRVSSISTLTKYPEHTIGAINDTPTAGDTSCTATKIGPRSVITASHCVLNQEGELTTSGWFHPGQTNATHPNAGGTAIAWSGLGLRDYRGSYANHRWDYAVLFLEDRLDSYNLSWLGVAWWSDGTGYANRVGRILGYPRHFHTCLASPRTDKLCDGWMYRDHRALQAWSFRSDEQLAYDIDTQGGQSGAALFTDLNGSWVIMGVHWGGRHEWGENRAARFRSFMWNDVCSWIAAAQSSHGQHSLCQ